MPHAWGMSYQTKLATCCYCGTRAALVLRGQTRHELSCAGCGAPIHDLKWLKIPEKKEKKKQATRRSSPSFHGRLTEDSAHRKKRRHKRRKTSFTRMASEIIDFVEDIFD